MSNFLTQNLIYRVSRETAVKLQPCVVFAKTRKNCYYNVLPFTQIERVAIGCIFRVVLAEWKIFLKIHSRCRVVENDNFFSREKFPKNRN